MNLELLASILLGAFWVRFFDSEDWLDGKVFEWIEPEGPDPRCEPG